MCSLKETDGISEEMLIILKPIGNVKYRERSTTNEIEKMMAHATER